MDEGDCESCWSIYTYVSIYTYIFTCIGSDESSMCVCVGDCKPCWCGGGSSGTGARRGGGAAQHHQGTATTGESYWIDIDID